MRTKQIAPLILMVIVLLAVMSPILFSSLAIVSGDASLWSIRYLAGLFPASVAGYWDNLFFTGYAVPAALLTPQRLLLPWLDPAAFIKWILISSALLTAVATWFWMRAQGRSPLAAVCTGIGLALSGHYFTMISAGHLGKLIMFPMIIGALACIETAFRKKSLLAFAWCGALLALAIGEQPDVTLMTGLLPAALILFKTFSAENSGPLKSRLGFTLAGGIVAGICLLAVAAPALTGQFSTHVKDVAPVEKNESAAQKWDWATQWSLPPEDTLELIAPAPLGTKSGDAKLPYWGRQGRSPGWEQNQAGFRNFRQEEQYAGVIFIFFAGLALTGLRKGGSHRAAILFWSIAALIFYLLALGRYGFLYRFFYELPFANSMRNPVKFMFAMLLCLGALSAYGIDALLDAGKQTVKNRPAKVAAILGGVFMITALCMLAARNAITTSLTKDGWGDHSAALAANLIFSSFYAGTMLLLATGWIAGRTRFKSAWFALLLPVLMAVDTGYIVIRHIDLYDAKSGCQSNSVIDFLKKQDPAPRVKVLSGHPLFQYWSNNNLPFNAVQQIDFLAEDKFRMPVDQAFFQQALGNNTLRYWQMTATQFALTDQATWRAVKSNPVWKIAFTPIYPFTIAQTATGLQTTPIKDVNTAPFLALKINGALPRAVLYSQWETLPDDQAVGRRMAGFSFNPETAVLLSGPDAPASKNNAAQPYIIPETTLYSPHRIDLTLPPQPAETVLLLNDRYDKKWTATVDGSAAKILRGNYLMRAVVIPPGSHNVSFAYRPDTRPVILSLTALLLLTLASLVHLFFRRRHRP